MHSTAADLTAFPPDARELVRAAVPEAEQQLSSEQLQVWLEGARRVAAAGTGLSPLIAYLRTMPALARK